ncbi:hypothetical protein LTR15_004713 [Elasticomyces elasticus]|nr:hypothetical protein LTR15_004713 [Elasticomyces elasticus]
MLSLLLPLLLCVSPVLSKCSDPSPAFPVPSWTQQHKDGSLASTFEAIDAALQKIASDDQYSTTSFSVSLTSETETLWSHHHTALKHNATRPGTTHINNQSQYRIASITKVFTTLGLLYQHSAGNLSLDDPISDYIPELNSSSAIPWKEITLRLLASQLSGIPREGNWADLATNPFDPTTVGLPPIDKEDLDLPACFDPEVFESCNWTQILPYLGKKQPVFAPGQKSTYSNVAFELLGLVLARVKGLSYENYMYESIFKPLKMESTTFTTPESDEHAVLPVDQFFWDVDEGIHNPTGGLYSSSADMSIFLRHVLTHYNALATGVNWFMPASWTGLTSFYGMPWEILRTERILEHSNRPVSFVTKGGAVPSYFSRITLMPEYGLGLTLLVGGESSILEKIQEAVTIPLVRVAEELVWQGIEATHGGHYTALNHSLNSSIAFAASPATGLEVRSFISNGTDIFDTLLSTYARLSGIPEGDKWRAQLSPTLLFKDETSQQGEIWRMQIVHERNNDGAIWDDFCLTDVDPVSYAGLPLNEVVFWHGEQVVELSAFRVKMGRLGGGSSEGIDGGSVVMTARDKFTGAKAVVGASNRRCHLAHHEVRAAKWRAAQLLTDERRAGTHGMHETR